MKILLLTNQLISKDTFIIGGWIQSLIHLLQNSSILTIGVAGLTEENESQILEESNITYYIIKKRKYNPVKRIYLRWKNSIEDKQITEEYLSAIENFQPDIIHIFGTESFLCNIIPLTKVKTVVHLQGILNPYLNVWFPPGFSRHKVNTASFNFLNFIRGIDLDSQYRNFKKRAEKEVEYFKQIRYVMGRTHWDKSMTSLLGQNIRYFHVEETLRPNFYTDLQWSSKSRKKIQLLSILSPSTYKGFDVILKTAHLLKLKGVEFKWIICGTPEEDVIIQTMEKIVKKKYSKNNVHFLEKKTASEIVSIMLDSDIFIHPSYIENSPNSVCEAQILGMPVIATNTGGVSSLIKDNETGLLVPSNDPYFLSESILSLLSSPDKMILLGKNARKTALQRHNLESIRMRIEKVYSEILKN